MDRHDFKPAAMEMADRPPSPLGRALFWVLVGLLAFCAACLCLVKVDVMARAPGVVVPDGETIRLAPLETGKVLSVQVAEGDRVKPGDVLVRMAADLEDAGLGDAEAELARAAAVVARCDALLTDTPCELGLDTPEGRAEARACRESRAAFSMSLAAYDRRREASGEEEASSAAAADLAAREERLAGEELVAMRELLDRDAVSMLEVRRAEREVLVLRGRRRQLAGAAAKAGRDKAGTARERDAFFARTRADLLAERTGAMADLEQAKARLAAGGFSSSQRDIVSPVAGTVQSLSVRFSGEVARAGEPAVVLVPDSAGLAVKALLPDLDAAGVFPGMGCDAKIGPFDWQKHGAADCVVAMVAPFSGQAGENGPRGFPILAKLASRTLPSGAV